MKVGNENPNSEELVTIVPKAGVNLTLFRILVSPDS